MTDELPDIGELEPGHTARIEYVSQRSGNPVEREGEVAEVHQSEDGNPIVYVHTSHDGFFDHTYVSLVRAVTTADEECLAAVSVSTQPETDAEERPAVGRTHAVTHAVARRQTLGIVESVIRVTPDALTRNEVL